MVNTQKKAISPVVATALLLVVAVVAVVGFQTWFNTYQSENFAKLNEQTAAGSAINFQLLTNNTVFLKNTGYEGTVRVQVGTCDEVSQSWATPSNTGGDLENLSITNCGTMTQGSSKSIRVFTDSEVYSFTGTVQ